MTVIRLVAAQPPTEPDTALQRQLQVTIKRVSEGIEQIKFNTGIAALMELLNNLETKTAVDPELLKQFVLLLSPYAPHITEELWEKLGHLESISSHVWPEFDEQALVTATVAIPVQVNGRVRATIEISPQLVQEQAEAAARAVPNVQKYLETLTVQKVIYLPGKLLNFVGK